MLNTIRDLSRARRWLKLRDTIRRTRTESERSALLRCFGEEIRALMPSMTKASTVEREDIARAREVATAQGVVIGAWMQMDPANPDWPGRDRLFVIRREDLINTCSVLASLGFFPPELVPEIVERVDNEGRRASVPGLEVPGCPPEEVPDLLWDSAVESARSKRRWREQIGDGAEWADPAWSASPAVWRSVAIFDIADPVTEQCRVLPGRDGERPAGLAVVVKAGREEAPNLADVWAESGWNAAVVGHDDCLGLYDALTTADMGTPFAVILATGSGPALPHISKTALRRREAGLLGELSDDQFHELMGEYVN